MKSKIKFYMGDGETIEISKIKFYMGDGETIEIISYINFDVNAYEKNNLIILNYSELYRKCKYYTIERMYNK